METRSAAYRFFHSGRAAPAAFALAGALLLPSAGVAGSRGHAHVRAVYGSPVVHGRVAVLVGGRRYYYHGGYFYRHGPRGYFLVGAPRGVVVPFLPIGSLRLHFGPTAFFYYGGVYYQPVPDGYVVVPKPETVYVEKEPAADGEEKPFVPPKTETVMVRNSNGSQTPVALEEADGKWKGPKGELYDSFPSEDQLKSVYGF